MERPSHIKLCEDLGFFEIVTDFLGCLDVEFSAVHAWITGCAVNVHSNVPILLVCYDCIHDTLMSVTWIDVCDDALFSEELEEIADSWLVVNRSVVEWWLDWLERGIIVQVYWLDVDMTDSIITENY